MPWGVCALLGMSGTAGEARALEVLLLALTFVHVTLGLSFLLYQERSRAGFSGSPLGCELPRGDPVKAPVLPPFIHPGEGTEEKVQAVALWFY